jgi:hypothetical protein
MPANDDEHLGPQFTEVLPKGSVLYHVTSAENAERIRRGGLQASEWGESGPGVYTTPDRAYAETLKSYQPGKQTFTLRTNRDLHLLDRAAPGGERHFESLAKYPAVVAPNAFEKAHANLAAAGYHGVSWRSRRSLPYEDTPTYPQPEIAIHDPSALEIQREGETDARRRR